ncbi:hypothetical protein [Streptomyces canus]|uniref:hypothetical protein n=1 Tax=Streptomyces canus TaxID=58343 RepID=UPI00038112CE|nr:hypothetical protein [Streptomyces canus]
MRPALDQGIANVLLTVLSAGRDVTVRISTPPSAMAQARRTAQLWPEDCEIAPITSQGDRKRAVADKADWISALVTSLRDGEVDVSVHAAKDVPSRLADGCVLAAVPCRDEPYDALRGRRGLAGLRPGARIGTSSARRRVWLEAARPDLVVQNLRGNVESRPGSWCFSSRIPDSETTFDSKADGLP